MSIAYPKTDLHLHLMVCVTLVSHLHLKSYCTRKCGSSHVENSLLLYGKSRTAMSVFHTHWWSLNVYFKWVIICLSRFHPPAQTYFRSTLNLTVRHTHISIFDALFVSTDTRTHAQRNMQHLSGSLGKQQPNQTCPMKYAWHASMWYVKKINK